MDAQTITSIKAHIEAMNRGEVACFRCGGAGHLDHNEGWILLPTTGRRTCFRCKGNGIEKGCKYVDPRKVRMGVIARLRGMVEKGMVEVIEHQALRCRDFDPYWPVLADVYRRAYAAARRIAN